MSILYELGHENESDFISNQLDEYNKKMNSFLNDDRSQKVIIISKNKNKIIGGGTAYLSTFCVGYIDDIWVDENYRNQNIGSTILNKLEKELILLGCDICHLETFDFQSPNFYKKNGYEIFGTLDYKKINTTEFFMKKELTKS